MSDPIKQWRESGEHLPDFMRDFHDQKELFKALDEVRQRALQNSGHGLYMKDMSWVDAHVYTIDVFLWVMAKYGYTLQKTRKKLDFPDIDKFVG